MEVNKPYIITNLCRYYKGGNINPFKIGDPRHGLWTLEWEFVNDYYQQNESLETEYELNFISHFPTMLKDAPYGAIFEPLKAFMFNRWYDSLSSPESYKSFLDYYLQNQ